MAEEKFEVKVGAGKIRVIAGDEAYGSVMVDLVVERDGREYSLPIVAIENPNDKAVHSEATDANATTVYVYGDLNDDAWTHKVKIPNKYIDDAVAELSTLYKN